MKYTLCISAFAHLLLLLALMQAGLLNTSIFPTRPAAHRINVKITSAHSLSPNNEIWQKVNRYAALPPEERLHQLKTALKKSQIIPTQSLEEIETHLGLNSQSHLPKPSTKAFDHQSSTIFSIVKKLYPSEKIGYTIVLVDAYGTTLTTEIEPNEVDSDIEMSYRAMSLLSINPRLKQLAIRFLAKTMGETKQNTAQPKQVGSKR